MSKWADYLITHVRYDLENSYILRVLAAPDLGVSLGGKSEWARADVLSAIKSGTTFMTAPPAPDGKITKGAPVRVVRIGAYEYLRTDSNATPNDNLGNLPRF